jgi:hypothetical protein
MNLQALPLLAVVVLSFTNRVGTWWGIAIMAACLVLGFIHVLALPDEPESEWEREDRPYSGSVLSFFVVTLPAFGAALAGHLVHHGWGALIGGVGVAFVCSALSALLIKHEPGF